PAHGLGADVACRDRAGRRSVLGVHQNLLGRRFPWVGKDSIMPNRIVLEMSCVVVLSVFDAACGDTTPSSAGSGVVSASASLTGNMGMDGSSTVLPITQAMSQEFTRAHPEVHIAAAGSGTGPGLQKLCRGELEIAAASRPINAAEAADCASHSIAYIELPV